MCNSDCVKLEIDEAEAYSLGPECSDVHVKLISRNSTRTAFFEVFSMKEKTRIQLQAGGDGMIVKDKGQRKRRKLGRKPQELKRKMSVSGVALMKMRRAKSCNIWRTVKS